MTGSGSSDDLTTALASVAAWLDPPEQVGPRIHALERDLDGTPVADAAAVAANHGVDAELLKAAMFLRSRIGKISDLIHAAAIALALPRILDADEVLVRPSLAAGNDPSRPYDVQTNKRAAEFKLARWQPSGNGAREKELFKDVVLLSAAPKGLIAEVYVLGPRPSVWLSKCGGAANTQLKGRGAMAAARDMVASLGEPPEVPVRDFVTRQASHVNVIDLEQLLPDLFATGP